MYYPICYFMPNYGPCQPQARLQVHPSASATITAAPTTTWGATQMAIESSVSKRKAMLRSIYSSNSAASSRSAAMAAMSTATNGPKEPQDSNLQDEDGEANEDSESDEEMYDMSGYVGLGVGALIGAIVAVLV